MAEIARRCGGKHAPDFNRDRLACGGRAPPKGLVPFIDPLLDESAK